MTDKVLFLDIDGPMIPGRSWVIQPQTLWTKFDPIAVATVVALLDKVGAKLVISSTWRVKGYERMVEALEDNGIDGSYLHEDWQTIRWTETAFLDHRADEIREWLSRHPEITKFAVIDDGDLPIENLIRVTFPDGLLMSHQRELFRAFSVSM